MLVLQHSQSTTLFSHLGVENVEVALGLDQRLLELIVGFLAGLEFSCQAALLLLQFGNGTVLLHDDLKKLLLVVF